MYILLPVCAFFLFQLLICRPARPLPELRALSMWIYLLHPWCIVLIRGLARLVGQRALLVDQSLVHYLLVCALSCGLALALCRLTPRKHAGQVRGRAWIELNQSALAHNVAALRARLPENCRLMPAVKANAYGHGAAKVGRMLNKMGVDAFCVACAAEGAALRRAGVRGEILVLGYTHPDELHLLRRYRLSQTVVDRAYAEVLKAYGRRLHVHVAVDTGMHRLGERSENIDAISEIFQIKNLRVDGMYTHLSADETRQPADRAFTRKQADAFRAVAAHLAVRGFPLPRLHMQASYGVLNYPELSGDYARVGIALYGVLSTGEALKTCPVVLRPVLSLRARIAAVKDLHPGEHAGYGLNFTAQRPMRVAALTIGYADGLPRSLSDGVGCVLIRGIRAPIVGLICMDQALVDVTDIPDVRPGDVATLIGGDGGAEITACDIAAQAETLSNDILSRLGGRLERIVV